MFLICFSIGFGRKNLQDKLGDTKLAPKPIETTELKAALITNCGATDVTSSIGLGEDGSQEMHHIYIGTVTDSSLGNNQANKTSTLRKTVRGTVTLAFRFPIMGFKVPIPQRNSTVATINQLNEDKIKGIVFTTPTKTSEFDISLEDDGAALEYSYQNPSPRTSS